MVIKGQFIGHCQAFINFISQNGVAPQPLEKKKGKEHM